MGSHHQFYTNESELRSWVLKNVGSGITKRSRHATWSLLKCDCGFGCANAIKYSYYQSMSTYVLVHIKYLLTLTTKFTWHLTREMMLTHLLKIRLWVSVVVMLPAKCSGS